MIIQITNPNNTVLLSKKSISTCLKLYSSLSNSSRSQLTSNSLLLKSNQTIKTLYYLNNSYNKRFVCISSPALLASLTNTLRNKKEEATQQQQKGKPLASSIVESSDAHRKDQISTHVTGARKVKQAAKDVSYGTIVFIGGALLVAMFYYLFSELFSRETPSGIYNESSKICLEDFNVRDALGTPIKVSAESGGRRVFQIRNKIYIEDGSLYMLINYYLEGPRNKGTVFCKVKRNEATKKFEYESIIVKLDHSHRGENRIYVKYTDANNNKIV